MKRLFLRSSAFLFATLLLIGCGGKSVSTVTGVVKYKGAPVPGGELILEPSDSQSTIVTAYLETDGHYTLSDITPGEYTVYFTNEMFNPKNKPVEYNEANRMKALTSAAGKGKGPNIYPGPPPGAGGNPTGGGGAHGGGASQAKHPESLPEGATKPGLKGTYVELPKSYAKSAGKSTHKITVAAGKAQMDIELRD